MEEAFFGAALYSRTVRRDPKALSRKGRNTRRGVPLKGDGCIQGAGCVPVM
jgi:hypothetical protein